MNNKKEIDVFSEFEKEIDGDWEHIHKKIEKEKIEKEYIKEKEKHLKNPKRPYIPSFEEFYKSLIEFAYGNVYDDRSRVSELMYMVRRIITPYTEKLLPKSLINIWDALCNEEKYDLITPTCMNCKRIYDVAYEITSPVVSSLREYDMLTDTIREHEMTIERKDIFCPKCGSRIAIIANGKLISISLVGDR